MVEEGVKHSTVWELITCIVQRGKADAVLKEAMEAGAKGSTIYFARGSGVREKLGLLRIAISPEKEVITIISPKDMTDAILDALVKAGKLDTPGHGIAYVTPISRHAGYLGDASQLVKEAEERENKEKEEKKE